MNKMKARLWVRFETLTQVVRVEGEVCLVDLVEYDGGKYVVRADVVRVFLRVAKGKSEREPV